jgi:hypothetical protein
MHRPYVGGSDFVVSMMRRGTLAHDDEYLGCVCSDCMTFAHAPASHCTDAPASYAPAIRKGRRASACKWLDSRVACAMPVRRDVTPLALRLRQQAEHTSRSGAQLRSFARSYCAERCLCALLRTALRLREKNCLHFSICACHPCAGAMLIFSVSFQF